MLTIYSILIYLGVISNGSTYTADQMNSYIQANQTTINTIESDPTLMTKVTTYDASRIAVLDPNEVN